MPLKDPEKRREYHRDYMRRKWAEDPAHKEKQLARVKNNNDAYRVVVDQVIAVFRKDGCRFCLEKEPCCMAAHHLDPSQKDFDIGEGRRRGYSAKRIQKELEKCICLCHNCHSKVHAGIIDAGSFSG